MRQRNPADAQHISSGLLQYVQRGISTPGSHQNFFPPLGGRSARYWRLAAPTAAGCYPGAGANGVGFSRGRSDVKSTVVR